ncbi:MAG: DNA circularization N-terminal domain-containing protein [Smithella sp.]|jgi:prophage DNA circulation protein
MSADFDQTALDLDTGSINGGVIQMETIEDTFEKAIAVYDYPYADGADLEDMGQKAHTIRIRCYFWDDAEQQTYDDHVTLIESLADTTLIDFVHPKYGLLQGKIQSIVVMHDDSIRKATLDISFIEQMRAALSVAAAQTVLSATEDAYQTGQDEQQDVLAADIKAAIPTADSGAVTTDLDASTGLLAQMQGYSGVTRDFVGQVEKNISTVEAVVNQVESPVDSLQATITYSLTLPGRILGSISNSLEKAARLYDSLSNYPSQFISKIDAAFDDLQSSFDDLTNAIASTGGKSAAHVMSNHLTIACAQRLALEAAAVYDADNEAANDSSSDFQVMNLNELESTLAIVRTRIEAAVEIARDMDSLKTMAAALLTQVNSVRLERERMIAVTLDNPMPLHLVCLRYGLDYSYAERLIKVNNIPQPNFTSGGIKVYAGQS